MRYLPAAIVFLSLNALLSTPALAGPHVRRGPTAPRAFRSHGAGKQINRPVSAGPRAMEPERVTAIQAALIRSGYLSGAPTGIWDAESQTAMTRLQADSGWQTKLVPDSRAIIKLGLGGSGSSGSQAAAAAHDLGEADSAVPAKTQPRPNN